MSGVKRGKIRRTKKKTKDDLSLSGAKSQGMKQLMAGAGVAVVGTVLVPLLSSLFTV